MNIKRILPNVKQMLIDRGYQLSNIPNTEYTPLLEHKIKSFMENEKDECRLLDIFVNNGETKDYVFLYKGPPKGFKINKVFLKKVLNYYSDIVAANGLNANYDNFTFVLVAKKLEKNNIELIDDFESENPHIKIFNYQKFLFNITSHSLVPKHSLYKESYKALLKKLMLDTPDKLPFIMYNDPVSRHFNFRNNEIIEIERDTLGKKIKVYRICKNFNYSHMSYSQKFDSNSDEESQTES